jgi:hypothetical protein
MNLITTQGHTMVNTCCTGQCNQGRDCPNDNVLQFQRRNELHRHFAPRTIEHYREPMTIGERVMLVLIIAASISIVGLIAGWGYQEMSSIDWSLIAEKLGAM